jgi:type I restriction enzyme, S subunit
MTEDGFRPLRQVATLLSGGTPSKANPEFWNGDVPWLTPKDMARFDGITEEAVSASAIGSGTRLAPAEAIFIAVRGMSLHNEIRIVRPCTAMAFNQDIKAVVANGVDARFLYYALMSKRDVLLASVEAAGHGTGRLPTDRLENILIPDRTTAEQETIAGILGALDDKIDLNRRMSETLEAMARAIFQDWFVTFGPTRAKQEGRPTYLAPDLWSLFPNRLDEDGKPEGWNDRPLADFMDLISGGTPRTSEPAYWGGEIPWFSVVDAPTPTDMYVIDTEKKITEAGLENCAATLLPKGAVIISARGTVGKLAVVGRPMAMNQSCYGAVGKSGIPSSLVVFLLKDAVQRLQANTHGSVFDTITRTTFQAVSATMPAQALAVQFGVTVDPLMARVLANVQESRTLAATRDLLLPKLMSGELRVKDAECAVAGVV